MKFVADIHLHSHFSRATSKQLNLENLYKWAQLKGIHVVGTGDIAHPGWLNEMKEKLEPAEEGLFSLKDEYAAAVDREIPNPCKGPVRFMLAGEISNIYKRHDKVRKIHNVAFLPSFEAVEKLQAELEKIGNIRSDGRPILGLDSRDLLEILLATDPQAHLIPAHIWTPWFALLGSMSGFDSVEECFDDLTPHIFALETGLSSDPPMNWRLSALDRYTLVSNSDAHSPQKLGREANLFDTELSYPAIFEALKTGDGKRFKGTIEFFPEEGKYHFDGHRKCGVRWDPEMTLAHDGICPECGRKVTVGVMHRVDKLADRKTEEVPPGRHPYKSLIPLTEVLAEIYGVGVNTKRVRESFDLLLSKLGSELDVLMHRPLEDLERFGGTLLSEGIRRMRTGEIHIAAGYDGEYGTIRIFDENERKQFSAQLEFFQQRIKEGLAERVTEENKISEPREHIADDQDKSGSDSTSEEPPHFRFEDAQNPRSTSLSSAARANLLDDLNEEQREAACTIDRSLIIVAGPGTGKTRTLTYRIAYLVSEKGVLPTHILAVTFTNKAAEEMAERLTALLGNDRAEKMSVCTFHALGLEILKAEGYRIGLTNSFSIIDEKDKVSLLRKCAPDVREMDLKRHAAAISLAKGELWDGEASSEKYTEPEKLRMLLKKYQEALRRHHLLDFDDLISLPVRLLEECPEVGQKLHNRFKWVSVDEYQDINFAQYTLLKKLLSPDTNLCVIGDPDQAIYGFRGSNREYFQKFQNDFSDARLVKLTKNYRSTQVILGASGNIISKSPLDGRGRVWSEIVSNKKVEIYTAPTENAEAEYVVHEIEKMVGGTSYFSLDSGRVEGHSEAQRSFADFAILYRLSALNHPLKTALDRSGMPFQIVGDTPLCEKKYVKDILSYLWFLENPASDFHVARILRMAANGLGENSVNKIVEHANQKSTPVWEFLHREPDCLNFSRKLNSSLSATVRNLETFRADCEGKLVSDLIEHIRNDLMRKVADDTHKMKDDIDRLVLKSKLFENDLRKFLEAIVLRKEPDNYDDRADQVTLMTLHAAKGLEFPVVFIVGCEEGLLPYIKDDKAYDPDEERRLMYVGTTRAQEGLILTHSKSRFLFGKKWQNSPSPFLQDIENKLKEIRQREYRSKNKKEPNSDQISLF